VTLGIWYLNKTGSTPGNIKPGNTVVIPNTNKLINSFVFSELNPEAYGAIDNTNYAVNLLVPTGTDLTTLTPTILVSDGATVSPASGAAENFTNPVIYTVTAQDGSTQNYNVTVTTGTINQANGTAIESSEKLINSFVLLGLNPEVDGTIDSNSYTVNLVVPGGTDVTTLTPTITVSDSATVVPNSGVTEDFTNPVVYTVTAQDGSIQDYTVTVTAQTTTTQ